MPEVVVCVVVVAQRLAHRGPCHGAPARPSLPLVDKAVLVSAVTVDGTLPFSWSEVEVQSERQL